MSAKKLMILGGSRFVVPLIEEARKMNIKTITVDYLPSNIAHKYSDEYHNISIVDKEAVLECAQSLKVDGITSFAADPGVTTAAYVAEKLGLPSQGTYSSVSILQNKGKFRNFLRENNFNCPEASIFSNEKDAIRASEGFIYPVIVKPVDSAGSKGCTRVDEPNGISYAIKHALNFSISGACIVEQFLEKASPSSDADAFSVDGKLTCVSFTSQYFDKAAPNPYVPASYAMPAAMPIEKQQVLKEELQRLVDLLDLKTGIYNVETRVAVDGKPYIMEVAPRGGGNRLAEMLCFATSGKTNLIRATVQASVGLTVDCSAENSCNGFWYQFMLHSTKDGLFKSVRYSASLKEHIVNEQLWVEPGEHVNKFLGANDAFGSLIVRFDSQNELNKFLSNIEENIKIDLL